LAAARAIQELGTIYKIYLGTMPDNQMDMVPLLKVAQLIESQMREFNPQIVYTHWSGDLNVDHQRTSQAVVTACRPVPNSSVKELYFFEVPSSTEWQVSQPFAPDCFVDISGLPLSLKTRALKCYQSEMRDWPHARSYKAIKALSRWRGASVGFEAAEAFKLGRALVPFVIPGPQNQEQEIQDFKNKGWIDGSDLK
jgi:LmbE family N-acetylglucosaminyl deacetylase